MSGFSQPSKVRAPTLLRRLARIASHAAWSGVSAGSIPADIAI
jgi:hypothetical protein